MTDTPSIHDGTKPSGEHSKFSWRNIASKVRRHEPSVAEQSRPPEPRRIHEVKLENALARLPEADSQALRDIGAQFNISMGTDHMTGGILIVGGTMTKTGQRRDIDLAVYVDSSPAEDLLPAIKQAERGLITLRSVAEDLATQGFEIVEETPPKIDTERNNPNILQHNGSIKIQRGKGTPIELINEYGGNMQQAIEQQNAPFAVLSRTEKAA